MKQRQVEVLAPAGSFESMKAAVAAGADAVYIGGSRFGARAYADNLNEDRMLEAIDYAHLHGVSIYMTVNTLVKEKELDDLFDYLNPYYMRGLDAVIVQDMGVFQYIKEHFPDLPIHASTQMTITGAHGAAVLKELGAARVVTARELSLEEIREIHDKVDVEIESFVHGALCYCYSGQCLMSSLIGGRSGNRGRCAQPCRLPYDVKRGGKSCQPKDQRYVMSLKDLCVLDILPELLDAGIYSLKIEGRMKSPRYTAGVVSIYRKYVDMYQKKGRTGYKVDPKDKAKLLDLFDRGGLTEGYYRQHNGRDMVALREKPAFRQANQQLFDYLDETYVNAELKEKICGQLVVEEGQPVLLKLWMENRCQIQVTGQVVQTAQNQPMTEEKLRKQIQKTGNTPFEFEKLDVEISGNVFLPVQALNELRRSGLEMLEAALLSEYRRESGSPEEAAEVSHTKHVDVTEESRAKEKDKHEKDRRREDDADTGIRLHVLLSDPRTLPAALKQEAVSEIQIESDGFAPKNWKQTVEICHDAGKCCVLAMPVIFRTEAKKYFDTWKSCWMEAGFDGILVRSLEEVDYLKQCQEDRNEQIPMYGDHNLYCFNTLAKDVFEGQGLKRLTLPLELNSQELGQLGCDGCELVAYGYLPVMVSAQCIQKTTEGCTRKPGFLKMKDRTGKELTVGNHCTFCYNTIYNPSPLSLLGQEQLVERLSPDAIRLQFTEETEQQAEAVISVFADSFLYGKEAALPFADFTRGHFKRGVE